jgi:hypothetical protein
VFSFGDGFAGTVSMDTSPIEAALALDGKIPPNIISARNPALKYNNKNLDFII